MKRKNRAKKGENIKVCLSCMAPNDGAAGSCASCGASLDGGSSLDPLKTIRAEGHLLRKATTQRPKFIVLLGAWILFAPMIAGTILLEISLLQNWDGTPSLIFFLLGVGIIYIAVKILFFITRNYSAQPEKKGKNY